MEKGGNNLRQKIEELHKHTLELDKTLNELKQKLQKP